MRSTMADKAFVPVFSALAERIREPMLEPILHPTPVRLRTLALSDALGHPLFYLVWTQWWPQPYEVLWQRLAMGLLGFSLIASGTLITTPPSRAYASFIGAVIWVTVPVFFTWMYLCNGLNEVWLATMMTVFPICYHILDWRIATVACLSGIGAGWLLFTMLDPLGLAQAATVPATHAVLLGFSGGMSLLLAMSASSLRLEQLRQTLGTMGILAHELRTPLATISLIGDALRSEAAEPSPRTPHNLDQLASRLQTVVRNMNRQIDLQISNAQLMRLPADRERLSAEQVARTAVTTFPYRNSRERDFVQVQVHQDFEFMGSESLFIQVLANLLKNALRALAARPEPSQPGDLLVEVDVTPQGGILMVTDRGPGIAQEIRTHLFQLFASTHRGSGHGLGLAFCQRVVHEAQGKIRVESQPGQGARFVIELPTRTVPTRRAPGAFAS